MFVQVKRTKPINVFPDTIIPDDRRANPIRSYRKGYGDCDKCVEIVRVFKTSSDIDCVSGGCHMETKALRRTRNSGGTTTQTSSNSEYLKKKKMMYEDKIKLTSTAESATTGKYNCGAVNDSCDCVTYYKPSNKYFNRDGGASSSSFTHKVKYNAIQSNASSLGKTFGHEAAVAYAYSGRPEAPFVIGLKPYVGRSFNMFNRNKKNVCCA